MKLQGNIKLKVRALKPVKMLAKSYFANMLIKTTAIVFRTVPYGESSMVATLFTQSHGLLAFLVNGVRSKSSKGKVNMLRPLSILHIECYYREGKNLQRIKEMRWAHIYTALPFETVCATQGLFLVEVVNRCIREEESNPELFSFIEEGLLALDSHEVQPDFHLRFLYDLSAMLGFEPESNHKDDVNIFDMAAGQFVKEPEQPNAALSLQDSQLFADFLQGLKQGRRERNRLLSLWEKYYCWHVEGLRGFKSIEVLRAVLT